MASAADRADFGWPHPGGTFRAPAVELRHLRYFLAVFEELHFGRAAERLHMAQPPLSQAIRRLETELGVELLHRTSRTVAPTEAGRAFAEAARPVLAQLDVAVAEARRAGAVSSLRIGSVPDLPVSRLLRLLSELDGAFPELSVRVTHLERPELVRRLRAAELDVALLHGADDLAGIGWEPVFPGEPLAAFLTRGHRLAGRPAIVPDDVREETLVTVPRDADPAAYDERLAALEQLGYRFRSIREAGGTGARDLLLALAGGGIALATSALGEPSGAVSLIVRRPLAPPLALQDAVLAWPADPPQPWGPVVARLRELARQLRRESRRDARAALAAGWGVHEPESGAS